MGGKKTVEKSREWEKERRDKLNTGFNNLYKLLPDHDPSISLSKMDILRKAAEYIRLLQDQNEEIIKSGDNDVLRNEAERLKKRVAHLLLKTKELVSALKAAGVSIPNNNKKKKKKTTKAQKVANGKDQNHIPLPSTGANTVQKVPCEVLVRSNGKTRVNTVPDAPLPGKKVKCGCEKAAKKNPLSEINCTTAAASSVHPVPCHVTVIPGASQPRPTILGPLQANIQTLAPTLGPGTLIFRDGRVVTVPPAIPQILVKPQPAFIVMQRAVAPLKRDKVPLIPKRRDITQTTFANKAPIPAIKTFRLESYPRSYKPKGKKKKEEKSDTSSPASKSHLSASQKTTSSPSHNTTSESAANSNSTHAKRLKRKADLTTRKTKVAKSTFENFPNPEPKLTPGGSEKSEENQTENPAGKDRSSSSSLGNEELPEVITTENDSLKGSSLSSCTEKPPEVNISSDPMSVHKIITEGKPATEGSAVMDVVEVLTNVEARTDLTADIYPCFPEELQVGKLTQNNDNGDNMNGTTKMNAGYSVDYVKPMQYQGTSTNGSSEVCPSPQKGPSSEISQDKSNIHKGDNIEALPTALSRAVEKVSVPDELQPERNLPSEKATSKYPLFSNADSQKNGIGGPNHYPLEGKEQLCRAEQPISKTGDSLESTPKSPAVALFTGALPASSSLPYPPSSGAILSTAAMPPNSISNPVNVTLPNAVPANGFPNHPVTQDAPSFNHPASLLPDPPPTTSTPSNSSSSMPVTSLFGNNGACYSNRIACSVPNALAPASGSSNGTKHTTHNYASSFSLNTAPSGVVNETNSQGATFPSLSKTQFCCEESHQIASSLLSKTDAKSSKDIQGSAIQKDVLRRNMASDLCTTSNALPSVKQSVNYRNVPFDLQGSSKQMKDVQYSKPTSVHPPPVSLGNGVTRDVGSSQKRCYSDQLDRTTTNQTLLTTSSVQSNNATSIPDASGLTANSQVYPFSIPVVPSESTRTESFFNYENPIATLPSDPFFSNFKPAEIPASNNTGFSYGTFTTQAPPVRSVARQLFPADPLGSISNSYNLDTNLPPLNSTAGQMFQFTSYSNTNSFRDPLLFTNDFLSTPTKNTTLESQDKDHATSANNFPDLLHPTSSTMNHLSNIPCSFTVGQTPTSSTYSDSRTGNDHRKQYQTVNQTMFNAKQAKSGSDGNFSMNVITSSSEMKVQDSRNPSDYNKLPEAPQNFNFPYLNTAQSLAPQMNLDNFNFNMRGPVPHSQNIPSRNVIPPNHQNSTNVDKNFQKTPSHGTNVQKSSHPKEFSINTSASSSSSRGLCDAQPNIFHNDANIYQESSKSSGNSNFRICSSHTQSNQGVQTQQSYLCKSQQVSNKPSVPSSGNQTFSCSSQVNQIHYEKKFPKTVQDSLYPASDNHMKISGCQAPDTNCSTVRTHKNYQPATSLTHSSLKTLSHSVNSSANVMFSHANANNSMLGSYSASTTVSQSIYSHPTTANQAYSLIGDSSRNTHQNLFRLSHMSTSSAQTNPPYQPNLCSTSQMFSTVETLAHQNLDHNRKPHKVGAQMVGPSNLEQDVNAFGMSTNQNQAGQKDLQADIMSNFSMSNITGYPPQIPMPNESNVSSRNQNPTYSQLPNNKQNTNVAKAAQQYPLNDNNPVPVKHCDYPLSSILTGLNDPVLNNTLVTNETRSNKAAAAPDKSCNDKSIDKQYSTNTEGSSFKTTENNSCSADYLRNKETERNFMPIIEDVRLNSEFSNDLFSSLQVPTGGAHADSISPTAAFLLAFPLVSTSKNSENPHESDPQDNNTSTPTTILQIGNIEPSNSELFHPLEFGKDIEPPDYLGQLPDKCKRKDVNGKQKKPYNSYSYPSISSDYNIHYDQSWADQSKSKSGEARKKNDKNKFCGNGNNYELCKDKKKKNKISVNWMAAPDVETFQKDQEGSSFQANLPFPMDIDALPDLCSNKKTNYSWSPSKSLLPLDSGLVIPSTLPTLVGDLALGTTTPADTYKRCDTAKKQEKSPEKQNVQKSQSNFLSVSQLVDPKSKKKLPDKCKKPDKKKSPAFQKRKDAVSNEPCMYPDSFLPPLGWDKYRYRNNYSAEALIASQDVNESANFSYQQNPNYFMGTDLNQEHHQNQQYQNSFNFPQNQFPSFAADEYQNPSFSVNNAQSSAPKRGPIDKQCSVATYPSHPPALQSYPPAPLPPSSAPPSSHPSNFTSNTTTSVSNFNLSTIFPEINERTASQGQTGPSQQHHQPQQNSQSHPHNNMSSFQNSNPINNYRPHNL